MKVLYWGTYDTGKPRNRILLRGLKECGVQVSECHYDLWSGVEDKSQIRGVWQKIIFFLKWLCSYPKLILQFFQVEKPDVIVVGYLGHVDVIVIWLFAKVRRTPVVWDAFISLYDTVVIDRKLIGQNNPLAILLFAWEWLACRAADLVILDTHAHAQFFVEQFGLSREKVRSVFVGVEPEKFPRNSTDTGCLDRKFTTVLFYGQFIPLHGIETIVEAARILKDENINWVLIGKGQEALKIQKLLDESSLEKLTWKDWVEYESLISYIHQADICLGIFGESPKASRVIPNKVYQILASGKPLITRISPAIKELLSEKTPGVILVPAASPVLLAAAILDMRDKLPSFPESLYDDIYTEVLPEKLGLRLRVELERYLKRQYNK
jgi:glycosyltransferase involved in cell wall biosynthesis